MEDMGKFTMPQFIVKNLSALDLEGMLIIPPAFHLWADSTEIVEIKDDEVVVKTTPTKGENLTEELQQVQLTAAEVTYIFPDATTAAWDVMPPCWVRMP